MTGPPSCRRGASTRQQQKTQASRYAFVGGFDGTSNVLAGKIFRDLPVSGTHGHSYVQAHRSREDLPADCILNGVDIAEAALQWRGELGYEEGAALHEGEFAAFVSYALANPTTFVALVDTYSVLDTGLRNFVTVALALAVRSRREIETPSNRHEHPRDKLTKKHAGGGL